jgi:hypothetical protein
MYLPETGQYFMADTKYNDAIHKGISYVASYYGWITTNQLNNSDKHFFTIRKQKQGEKINMATSEESWYKHVYVYPDVVVLDFYTPKDSKSFSKSKLVMELGKPTKSYPTKLKEDIDDNKLEEGKKDEQNLIKFAGENLAKRFLAIRQKLKSPENDFYYWIKNKTPQELEAFLNEKESTKSSVQIKREIKDEGAELVTEGNGYKVYKIKTYEASCLYGANTKWCISSDDISHWKGYKKEGAEFYFFIGHGTKYALMVKRRTEVIKLPRTIMFFFSDEEPPKKKTIKTNIELYNEKDDLITEKYDELNLPKIPGVNIVFEILSVE